MENIQECPICGFKREYPSQPDWWSNNGHGTECHECYSKAQWYMSQEGNETITYTEALWKVGENN